MFLSKASNGIYYLFFKDELGRRRKVSTKCRLKAEATKFLQAFKVQEHERRRGLARVSLSDFMQSYLRHSGSVHTPKTVASNTTALKEFLRVVGDIPLHKIGVREIETFLAAKRQEASAWTARKYYIALASAFETATRWGNILCNPFRTVQKPKVPETQPAFFSREDFAALLRAISDNEQRELVIVAVSTGMRQGELLAMRWQWVDFSRKVITVRSEEGFATKNKRSRVVPMNETVWRLLLERRERATSETDFVFHSGGKRLDAVQVSKAFKRSVRQAGLSERLHFHSLRHTFASWLAQDGVSLFTIQKLLGHTSSSTTQIYSHLQPEKLHSTVARISVN